VTGPIAAKLPAIPPAPPDRVVESVYLPGSLHGHASMSYVLGQEPGKLRTKDIQVRAMAILDVFLMCYHLPLDFRTMARLGCTPLLLRNLPQNSPC
jgi:hypothetical protein